MNRGASREAAMHESPGDAYLTSEEVAAWVRVSPTTLCRWRQADRGPRVTWLSPTCPRYKRTDVEAWLERLAS